MSTVWEGIEVGPQPRTLSGTVFTTCWGPGLKHRRGTVTPSACPRALHGSQSRPAWGSRCTRHCRVPRSSALPYASSRVWGDLRARVGAGPGGIRLVTSVWEEGCGSSGGSAPLSLSQGAPQGDRAESSSSGKAPSTGPWPQGHSQGAEKPAILHPPTHLGRKEPLLTWA